VPERCGRPIVELVAVGGDHQPIAWMHLPGQDEEAHAAIAF